MSMLFGDNLQTIVPPLESLLGLRQNQGNIEGGRDASSDATNM